MSHMTASSCASTITEGLDPGDHDLGHEDPLASARRVRLICANESKTDNARTAVLARSILKGTARDGLS